MVASHQQVTCSRGVKIAADCKLSECESRNWDAVVCPGGMPGAANLKESEPLEAILKKQVKFVVLLRKSHIMAAPRAAPSINLQSCYRPVYDLRANSGSQSIAKLSY